jgi:hypothetical protein
VVFLLSDVHYYSANLQWKITYTLGATKMINLQNIIINFMGHGPCTGFEGPHSLSLLIGLHIACMHVAERIERGHPNTLNKPQI